MPCEALVDNPFLFLWWLFHHPPRGVDELGTVVLLTERVHGVVGEVPPERCFVPLVDNLERPLNLSPIC